MSTVAKFESEGAVSEACAHMISEGGAVVVDPPHTQTGEETHVAPEATSPKVCWANSNNSHGSS